MRTTTKNTVYLSDYFSMPLPTRASSHQAYLRKLQYRRLLWALLPGVLSALGLLLLLVLTVAGVGAFALSVRPL